MYKKFLSVALASSLLFAERATAQSEIYPQHFDLSEVTLLNGPMKTMMETNDGVLSAWQHFDARTVKRLRSYKCPIN